MTLNKTLQKCECAAGNSTINYTWSSRNNRPQLQPNRPRGRITCFNSESHLRHLRSWNHSLLENFGGLSFMSVSVMVTVVVPDKPPMWPPMSLAWMTTRYSSLISRSIPWRATFMVAVDGDSSELIITIWNMTDGQPNQYTMQTCTGVYKCPLLKNSTWDCCL